MNHLEIRFSKQVQIALLAIAIALAQVSWGASAQTPSKAPAQGATGDKVKDNATPPDLEVHHLGLTSTGSVIYQVVNKGTESTKAPFLVDIYVNGVRRDTIRHEPLPGMSLQTVESNKARFPDCKEGTVRVVLDIQKTVRESNEKNNERSAQLTPPCPKGP